MYSIMKMVNMGALVLFGNLLLSGCSSLVKTESYSAGRIWVLPAEDAVAEQDGDKNTLKGSGEIFGKYLAERFSSPFSAFSATIAPGVDSLSELFGCAHRFGADYILRTSFGEVHLAKPGTNRPDRAYLETAYLFDVKRKTKVWELSRPLYVEKSNDAGKDSVIIKLMAAYVADSIQDHAVPSTRR